MCDQDTFEKDRLEYEAKGLVTRRQFGVMMGAGMIMMLPQVKTLLPSLNRSDHQDSGRQCGQLLRPSHHRNCSRRSRLADIFGLRPAFRQMGKRLAESGYSVLVINPFYRTKKAPTADQGAATPIQQLLPLAQAISSDTIQMTDAKASWHGSINKPPWPRIVKSAHRVIAWEARWRFRTAAAVPDRVGAVASFHGGNLVTNMPNSPHLQAAKSKAQFLIAIAQNDDMSRPTDKTVPERNIRPGKAARGNRSLRCGAWLVPAGFRRLQQGFV
jgi:carboxymethylenebutenolidase